MGILLILHRASSRLSSETFEVLQKQMKNNYYGAENIQDFIKNLNQYVIFIPFKNFQIEFSSPMLNKTKKQILSSLIIFSNLTMWH